MSTVIPPTPPSPGVGTRRRGPKSLPRLPMSAFTPPNSGSSEKFPLPPSPSTVHPEKVIDANVIVLDGDLNLSEWKQEAGQVLGGRIGGVVLSLPESVDLDPEVIKSRLESGTPILSLVIPFRLEDAEHSIPSNLASSAVPFSFKTVFTKPTPNGAASLKWALSYGRPIDIDIQTVMSDSVLENFEEMLSKATADLTKVPPIILSNWLPPPHDVSLSIVKLLKHPTYREFQSQTAALSLIPSVHIKFLPPPWEAQVPMTPITSGGADDNVSRQLREAKRRIKMFLGPVMEAFGYERIIFGSSPSSGSTVRSNAGVWYEVARESLAELGVDQEFIDAVFFFNAKRVYGS